MTKEKEWQAAARWSISDLMLFCYVKQKQQHLETAVHVPRCGTLFKHIMLQGWTTYHLCGVRENTNSDDIFVTFVEGMMKNSR